MLFSNVNCFLWHTLDFTNLMARKWFDVNLNKICGGNIKGVARVNLHDTLDVVMQTGFLAASSWEITSLRPAACVKRKTGTPP